MNDPPSHQKTNFTSILKYFHKLFKIHFSDENTYFFVLWILKTKIKRFINISSDVEYNLCRIFSPKFRLHMLNQFFWRRDFCCGWWFLWFLTRKALLFWALSKLKWIEVLWKEIWQLYSHLQNWEFFIRAKPWEFLTFMKIVTSFRHLLWRMSMF